MGGRRWCGPEVAGIGETVSTQLKRCTGLKKNSIYIYIYTNLFQNGAADSGHLRPAPAPAHHWALLAPSGRSFQDRPNLHRWPEPAGILKIAESEQYRKQYCSFFCNFADSGRLRPSMEVRPVWEGARGGGEQSTFTPPTPRRWKRFFARSPRRCR